MFLTSPHLYLFFFFSCIGPPVRSTSYIDEPDSPSKDDLTLWTQEISSLHHTPPSLDLATTSPSQSYLNLIADSANCSEDDRNFDAGSAQLGVATGGRGVSEVNLIVPAAGVDNMKMTGHVLADPPDIIRDSVHLPTQSLELCTEHERCEKEEGSGERAKVKHGHSRTWQKNVHCLETEV